MKLDDWLLKRDGIEAEKALRIKLLRQESEIGTKLANQTEKELKSKKLLIDRNTKMLTNEEFDKSLEVDYSKVTKNEPLLR